MSYVPIGYGATATAYNAVMTPALPAAVSAGNLLLLHTGTYLGTFADPSVAGWTPLTPATLTSCCLFGRIATGSDTPSVNWGTINSFAYAMVSAYSGPPASLSGIVAASATAANNSRFAIGFPALTITTPNCLVIAAGSKNKTATEDAATFGSFAGFTLKNTYIPSGTMPMAAYNDWIQTTATSIAAGVQNSSVTEATTQAYSSYIVALLPGGIVTPSTSRLASMGVG